MKNKLSSCLLSASIAFLCSMNASAAVWHGDVQQQLCIELNKKAPKNLTIKTHQSIYDGGNGGNENEMHETFTIWAGTAANAQICTDSIFQGRINTNGLVNFSYEIYEGETISDGQGPIKTFVSSSSFNGEGANNTWDLDEQDQCWDGEKGIILEATNSRGLTMRSCNKLKKIPDENVVKVIFAPDV